MPKAFASPTKDFFVKMLTRDISLEDTILDLIDNSVDAAWHSTDSRPMTLAATTSLAAFTIDIQLTPQCFRITDNCGGMSLYDATHHAFAFGRTINDESDEYTIGVYGIGMKRAVFKIGSEITIRSTTDDDGQRRAFKVPISVPSWLASETFPWDFDIEDDEPLRENGVEVEVCHLTPSTETAFGNPAFIQNLRRVIARDYTLYLNTGLKVVVNGEAVQGLQIDLRTGQGFAPLRINYTDNIDGYPVTVELIAGMAAPPPDEHSPEESDDGEKRFGWYIGCNGRMVLAADRTAISGWGTEDWPIWHRQYSGFIGVVLFTAAKAIALPLTTTKRNVDTSSEVFRRARPKMREAAKTWIAYTNARKQDLEEAKRIESSAQPLSLFRVQEQKTVALPALVPRPAERLANIAYSVPVSRLRSLAKAFGNINMTYREVGIRSFDYAFDDLAEKE